MSLVAFLASSVFALYAAYRLERIMSAIETLTADVAAMKDAVAKMASAASSAVAEIGAETAKIKDLMAQLAAMASASPDAVLAALAVDIEAATNTIAGSTAALAAAVPAPASPPETPQPS